MFLGRDYGGQVRRSGAIPTSERGAELVAQQHNVEVSSSCKWPTLKSNEPPRPRSKLSFKAIEIQGQEMTFPATLSIKNGPYTIPIRYRLQSDRFPDRCGKCHQAAKYGG